ncbi:hypothetical protein [Arthrobacter castelli]|uniref:hypothetical protein n=1 Tax=Arthrobacter castelli TaxID=271431 RepID=UPI00041CC135|nr:hypothetical protein [Arthrobacter castelli]
MSTNYGRGDEPDTHQTEPIGSSFPTKPIRGTEPGEPSGAEHKPDSAASSPGVPRPDIPRHGPAAPGGTTAAPQAGDLPAHEPTGKRQRPRAGTVVWGLIIIALAVLLILGQVASISLNMGQVVIGLLLGAGLALVIGGIISAGNREKDDKRA